jgi:DHA1 family bicyclomycin/chloramphenicol resistance-like MFS transporter
MDGLKGQVSEAPAAPMAFESRGVVALLLSAIPLSQIPLDAYTPAMPDMVRDLAASNALVQNTVTVYVLGMCLALVPVGMLADFWGRRRTLLAGLALLIVASVACAAVNDVWVLLGLRFLQGLAASSCMVVPYAVAADLFRGTRLTAVSGLLGIAWGLAPVLAPAVGGFIVQYVSWRFVFTCMAMLAAMVLVVVLLRLPETLSADKRVPFHPGSASRIMFGALRDFRFVAYASVFGLIASAQLAFGVVAPFLYQQNLGLSAATYGLIALVVGGANLSGEMACTSLATRITPRQLCFGALTVYFAGALVLVTSGMAIGSSFFPITLGGMLALAGCGTLCPTLYGMALGLFSNNLGLIGGFISSLCFLAVSVTMALAAYLPETSQAPLGWIYVAIGAIAAGLLAFSLPAAKDASRS